MDNQANINKESWKETLHIIVHPAVLIPSILGIGAIFVFFKTDDEYWKMILTAFSSIGIGIGVNYFTFFFKDNTKYNNLLSKITDMDKETAVLKKELELFAKNSVRVLENMSDNIISQCNSEHRGLNTNEVSLMNNISTLIESYTDYYKPDYTAKISRYKKLEFEIGTATNEQVKVELNIIKNNYDFLFETRKVKEITDATGSLQLGQRYVSNVDRIAEPDSTTSIYRQDNSGNQGANV